MKILSCGAGMQSTRLALMSCGNAKNGVRYLLVPIYDAETIKSWEPYFPFI